MQKRTRRLLFAGGALLAAALLALLWLRSPSPADPRGYIPLQRIPAAPFTDGIGDFATPEGLWDFRLLQKYRIHLSYVPASLIDGAEEDDLTRWDNAAIYDFLRRIASGKPAALREMSYNYEVLVEASLNEVYAYPQAAGVHFLGRADHRRCTDSCHRETIQEASWTSFQACVTLSRRGAAYAPVAYSIRFPSPIRMFQIYSCGYDSEMDAEMESLLASLAAAGIIEYSKIWYSEAPSYRKGENNVQKIN